MDSSRAIHLVLVLSLLVAGLLLPGAAKAAVTYSATGTPSTVTLPVPQTVTYTLSFENTGVTTEEVAFRTQEPRLAEPWLGVTMGRTGAPALTNLVGATTITSITSVSALFPANACMHFGPNGPYGAEKRDVNLSIPPGASGRLTYEYRLGDFPPHLGESFAPTFLATSGGVTQSIPTPEPVRLGATGVNFFFNAAPRRGKLVASGSTQPALNRQVVRLERASLPPFKDPQRKILGKVRSNRFGKFRLRVPLPRQEGTYGLTVSYRSQDASLAGDSSCLKPIVLPARPKS